MSYKKCIWNLIYPWIIIIASQPVTMIALYQVYLLSFNHFLKNKWLYLWNKQHIQGIDLPVNGTLKKVSLFAKTLRKTAVLLGVKKKKCSSLYVYNSCFKLPGLSILPPERIKKKKKERFLFMFFFNIIIHKSGFFWEIP